MTNDDDGNQIYGDRNAMAGELASVDFPYDEIDGEIKEDVDEYREAAKKQMDFLKRVFMVIQDYRGDKEFTLDCACLALGFLALARAKTQEEIAVRYKCTRANVSNVVNSIQSALGIDPLPWQRNKDIRRKFSDTRKGQLKKL